jgi:hypothetical protein
MENRMPDSREVHTELVRSSRRGAKGKKGDVVIRFKHLIVRRGRT